MVGDGFDTAVGVGEFSDREVTSNAVVDALEGCAIGVESTDQGAWRDVQLSCSVVEAAVTVRIEQRLANSQRERVLSQAGEDPISGRPHQELVHLHVGARDRAAAQCFVKPDERVGLAETNRRRKGTE